MNIHNEAVTVPCGLCGTPTTMLGTQRCDSCWELERRVEQQPLIAMRIALQVLNQRHAKVVVEKLRTETRQLQALVTAAQSQEPAIAAFWGEVAALPPDARAEFDRFMVELGYRMREKIGGPRG